MMAFETKMYNVHTDMKKLKDKAQFNRNKAKEEARSEKL
jgi:hypothetical protein